MNSRSRWVWCSYFAVLLTVCIVGNATEAVWKIVKERPYAPGVFADDDWRLFFVDAYHGWVIGGHYWQLEPGNNAFVGYRTNDGGGSLGARYGFLVFAAARYDLTR